MGFVANSFRVLSGESGSVNSAFQTSYTKTFLVLTDDVNDSVFFVGSHPNLPRLFTPHPDDPRAYCVSIMPQQDQSNPLVWRITCQWSMTMDAAGYGGMPTATGNPAIDSQQSGKPPSERVENPLNRPNDYSYDTVSIGNEVVEYDTFEGETLGDIFIGNPIATTAGQPFEKMPEREIFCLQVTIGRNLPGAPNAEWDMLNGCLNKNAITVGTRSCAARTVRMLSTSAQLVNENTVSYWRWTHRVLIRPTASDWQWKPLNKGTYGKCPFIDTPGGAVQYRFHQTNEKPFKLQGMQLLDKDSFVIALNPGKKPHTLNFNYFNEATFPTVL